MKRTVTILVTMLGLGVGLASFPLSAQQLEPATAFAIDRQQLCSQQWGSSRSRDQRLYEACLVQQRNAYTELSSMHSFYASQSFYRRYALPFCQQSETRDGVTDAQLLLFCLQEEIQGYEEVQDYLRRYRSQRVRSVVNSALTGSGSWTLAARQLKTNANLKLIR